MDSMFSDYAQKLITYSREEATRLGCNYIGVDHFFLGMLREPTNTVRAMLAPIEPFLKEIRERIERRIAEKESTLSPKNDDTPLNVQAERAINLSFLEQVKHKQNCICPEHILLALLFIKDSKLCKELASYDYNYGVAEKILYSTKSVGGEKSKYQSPFMSDDDDFDNLFGDDVFDDDEEDDDDEILDFNQPERGNGRREGTLESHGTDITAAASSGLLDPIVGRENELERMIQILCRRKKNNPIIIGESGVGKTALVEGLALRIVEKKVPRNLLDKKIISLDIASLLAGTKYRGDFEKRIKSVIDEVKNNENTILLIDEIHTLIGAGNASGAAIDASSIIKAALTKGEIQCIGTTTFDDYRLHIDKDVAFGRRFQKVVVEPPNSEETVMILNKIKKKYEEHHLVRYSDDALRACVSLTDRYITDRFLPDKAIDAMDEAGSRVHIKHSPKVPNTIYETEQQLNETRSRKLDAIKDERFEDAEVILKEEIKLNKEISQKWSKYKDDTKIKPVEVTLENVAEVVSLMTGIPVNRISSNENNKLVNLEATLMAKVIGQDDAVKKISRAIKRNRAGLKDPNKPIGSFIFMGQTGVGKTYLARTLATTMFDSEDALIRIDMSEYSEKFNVSRLIGAPPGYVGHEEGGQLTEKVRRKPYSVILLDEIEKAHPDVYNLLLHTLDYGFMTDGMGRKIDFRNTIIIMTSNLGSRQVKDFGGGIGFNSSSAESKNEYAKSIIEKAINKTFSPEFLNRIDEIIHFNVLNKEDVKAIINLEIAIISKRMTELSMNLIVKDSLIEHIINKEWDIQYGARPIHRAIQKHVEDPVSEKVIMSNMQHKNVNVIVDYVDGEVQVEITEVEKKAETEKVEEVKEEPVEKPKRGRKPGSKNSKTDKK